MIYGYHRTSTKEQNLDRGIREIENFCQNHHYKLERIFTDQHTGKNFNRPRYVVLRDDVLREGDWLIITEIDRLGRNKKSTLDELRKLADKGVRVMILEIPTTLQDMSNMGNDLAKMILDTINHMLIEIYATMAEAEIQKKEKRQREGIEAKRQRGDWSNYGRPQIKKPKDWDRVYQMWKKKEITAVEAMNKLHLKKTTFYRMVQLYESSNI